MAGIAISDDLRLLSEERIAEARTLFIAGHFSGAYYLAGYGVELGLKATITSSLVSHVMPWKKDVEEAHSHDFKKLADKAGVDPAGSPDPNIRTAWNTILNWKSEDRYRLFTEVRAGEMVDSAEELVVWLKPTW